MKYILLVLYCDVPIYRRVVKVLAAIQRRFLDQVNDPCTNSISGFSVLAWSDCCDSIAESTATGTRIRVRQLLLQGRSR